jgi:DNA-binding transcriptional MerR regulator
VTDGPDRPGSVAVLAIGQVLRRLRDEFPDISISKIRFLESAGLVEPDRAPSGYRRFSEIDVERLRFVLRAQRDQYLPLKVIKDQLADLDRGVSPVRAESDGADAGPSPGARRAETVAARGAGDFGHPDAFAATRGNVRLTEDELREAAGLDTEALRQLQEYRLLPRAAGGHYDEIAVAIAATAARLATYGLQPRHLRAFKMAADREIGMFEQLLIPLRRTGNTEAAEETLRELAALSVRMHALLVKSGLQG